MSVVLRTAFWEFPLVTDPAFWTKDLKDACEYNGQGEGKAFIDAWWQAERFTPDGIIDGAGLWDVVNQPVELAKVQYPFSGLNDLTYGVREGELITITAGSGLGKSQFLREIVYHILNNSNDENIGLLFLEESVKRTAKSIMSLAANKPLHLPDTEATNEELRSAFDATLGTGRVFLFDHFGSTAIDNIINRVRFMAKALDCKYIFLDHVSIVVSAQDNGDERKALDEIMTKLRMIVQSTGIALADFLNVQEEIKNAELAKQAEAQAKATAKAALLDRLGITADEAKLLLS